MFDAIKDMNSIDGVIADLASKTNRPQGYPFSKVTLYSVCPEIKDFMPDFIYVPAENVPSMRKLDFKKAGKIFGDKIKEMKNDLSSVPDEFIITASRFDAVDEPTKKTTGCRKYLIEIENKEQDDRWLAIQFRKAIKKYITEDMGVNILPAIFGDKYPDFNESCVARVTITIGDCSERLYQALQVYGVKEFAEYPIRIKMLSRSYICENYEDFKKISDHSVNGDFGKCLFSVNILTPELSAPEIQKIPPNPDRGVRQLSAESIMRLLGQR